MTSEINPRSFLLRSRRIVLLSGELNGAVEIRGERIAAIYPADQIPAGLPIEDLGDLALLPGLLDAHVHINEPGRTEWEGFETATRAALASGITTLLDMPLNSTPVCTTADALRQKRAAARGKLWADVGFYGGLVHGNAHRMRELIDEGIFGVKAFLCDSGLEEFQAATEDDLREAMPVLAEAGVPLLVHAELPCGSPYSPADRRKHAEWLASRPPEFELRAIEMVLRLGRETDCHVHIVHLSTADALPMLAEAQQEGVEFTVETCPHYLIFDSESIPDGDTRFKCAPPIRSAENRERLWQGLRDGLITRIASDHSPCPPELKALDSGDFFQAWGGISSLQLGLPAVWTEARKRGFSLSHVVRWMNTEPAGQLSLRWPFMSFYLPPGHDIIEVAANVFAFDPDGEFRVNAAELQHRHKVTPYDGTVLRGIVKRVWQRGHCVFRDGHFTSPAHGQILFPEFQDYTPDEYSVPIPADLPEPARNQVLDLSRNAIPPSTLDRLNSLSPHNCIDVFFRCCGSMPWATQMAKSRPYLSTSDLYGTAACWFEKVLTTQKHWLEPFSHHPRIGDVESLRAKFASTRTWALQEQSGTAAVDEETLRALAAGNAEYEKKFGYIFIVCATGKSADEMLALLRARLKNNPEEEWRIAAEEQKKITYLRLGKLEIPQ